MKKTKIFSPLLAVGLSLLISAQAWAANKVFWDGQTLNGVSRSVNDARTLVDDEALAVIGQALDNKLKSLQLPFELAVRNAELKNATGQVFMDMSEQYALIPIVLDDSTSTSWYEANGVKYYKTIVRTNLSVMLCGYGGSMLDRVNFLYNIPLAGYGIVKTKGVPPTKEQLRTQFISNAQQIIAKNFAVPANIVDFMDPKFGKTKTYQVADVKAAVQVQNCFKDNEAELQEEIIPYVASSYTSAFAEVHPEYVVLPEKSRGNGWQLSIIKHISNNLSESNIETDTGARDIQLELLSYNIQQAKASSKSKNASFFDKYILKGGMKDLSRKKSVQVSREYQIPNNIRAEAEISLPNFYGYAAKMLAKVK